jgi:hypothetical protein
VVRNRTHIPVADPPLDRTGSGDLESVAWYLAMAGFRLPQQVLNVLSGFPWEFSTGISNA